MSEIIKQHLFNDVEKSDKCLKEANKSYKNLKWHLFNICDNINSFASTNEIYEISESFYDMHLLQHYFSDTLEKLEKLKDITNAITKRCTYLFIENNREEEEKEEEKEEEE